MIIGKGVNSALPDHAFSAGTNYYVTDIYSIQALTLTGLFSADANQKNSIITFNYDLEIEKSLNRINVPYSYGLKYAQYDIKQTEATTPPISVLKLHGSINWAFPGKRGEKLTVYQNSHDAFIKGKHRLLIPPTWQKAFTGPLVSVWQNSIKSLSTATRLIIGGFSFPETDIHFKYLLAAGLKDNISLREIIILNLEPEESMMLKLKNVFQPEYMKNAKVNYQRIKISSYLSDVQHLPEINRNSGLYIN